MEKERKNNNKKKQRIAAFHIVYINLSILLLFLFDAEIFSLCTFTSDVFVLRWYIHSSPGNRLATAND